MMDRAYSVRIFNCTKEEYRGNPFPNSLGDVFLNHDEGTAAQTEAAIYSISDSEIVSGRWRNDRHNAWEFRRGEPIGQCCRFDNGGAATRIIKFVRRRYMNGAVLIGVGEEARKIKGPKAETRLLRADAYSESLCLSLRGLNAHTGVGGDRLRLGDDRVSLLLEGGGLGFTGVSRDAGRLSGSGRRIGLLPHVALLAGHRDGNFPHISDGVGHVPAVVSIAPQRDNDGGNHGKETKTFNDKRRPIVPIAIWLFACFGGAATFALESKHAAKAANAGKMIRAIGAALLSATGFVICGAALGETLWALGVR